MPPVEPPSFGTSCPSERRRTLAVAIVLLAVAVLMTWPLAPRLSHAVHDRGDPLLNAWILAWDTHKLTRLELSDLFDANIFHPLPRTLAYSEHLIPQALVAAPFLLLTHNPVLAHNVVMLIAMVTSGLGMYLLARDLIGSRTGAVLAALAFAFSPFMLAHLAHVQVLSAGGIPLVFWFLERLLRFRRMGDTLGCAAAISIQMLANGYYALFLALFVTVFLAVELPRRGLLFDGTLWRRWVMIAALVALTTGPFFLQYIQFQAETGFQRSLGATATAWSYLGVAPHNRLWGPWLAPFGSGELSLFPTLTIVVSAAVGIASLRRRRAARDDSAMVPYLTIGAIAVAFTFGEFGPYPLIRDHLPGFDSIRAVARFHLVTWIPLALLSAVGIRTIQRHRHGRILAMLLTVTFLVEAASCPIPWQSAPEIGSVYSALAARSAVDDAVLEVPLPGPGRRPGGTEAPRMLASTRDWRPRVNGYSGFEPVLYRELRARWHRFGIHRNLIDARDLGVRWIIVHAGLSEVRTQKVLAHPLTVHASRHGDAWLVELDASPPPAPTPPRSWLERSSWRVDASHNPREAIGAIDGSTETRWTSGRQRPGTRFRLDLGRVVSIDGCSLTFGPSASDYPRGYRVEGSPDGTSWRVLAAEPRTWIPIREFIDPRHATLDVSFPASRLRYLRIVQTGRDPHYYWSIHDLQVHSPIDASE